MDYTTGGKQKEAGKRQRILGERRRPEVFPECAPEVFPECAYGLQREGKMVEYPAKPFESEDGSGT